MFRRKSDCQIARELLSPYIDGQLGAAQTESVERHLQACAACRRELEALRATVGLLRRVSPVPAPRSFALPQPPPAARPAPRPVFAAMRYAAAAAVVLMAFVFAGDAAGLFGPGLAGDTSAGQGATLNESDGGLAPLLSGSGEDDRKVPPEGDSYYTLGEGVETATAVLATEIALSAATAALLAATTAVWWRRHTVARHAWNDIDQGGSP